MEAVGIDLGLLAPTLLAQLAAAVRGDVPDELVASLVALLPRIDGIALKAVPGTPYSRQKIYEDPELEVMIANWEPDFRCAPHDHGGASGFVALLRGDFNERRFAWDGPSLAVTGEADRSEGGWIGFGPEVIHDMVAPLGGLTLHAYAPPPQRMNVYDLEREEVLDLVGNFGAWIPDGDVPRTGFAVATRGAGTFTRVPGGRSRAHDQALTPSPDAGLTGPFTLRPSAEVSRVDIPAPPVSLSVRGCDPARVLQGWRRARPIRGPVKDDMMRGGSQTFFA